MCRINPSYQQQQDSNEVKVNNQNWQRRQILLPQISLAANNGPPLFLSLLLLITKFVKQKPTTIFGSLMSI